MAWPGRTFGQANYDLSHYYLMHLLYCSGITILRLLRFIYIYFLLSDYVDTSGSCALRQGADVSDDASNAIDSFFLMFTVGAALASCYANAKHWLWTALVTGIVYLGLLSRYEFYYCARLMADLTGDGGAIVSAVVGTFDLAFCLVTLVCLLWIVAEDLGFSVPASRSHVDSVYSSSNEAAEGLTTAYDGLEAGGSPNRGGAEPYSKDRQPMAGYAGPGASKSGGGHTVYVETNQATHMHGQAATSNPGPVSESGGGASGQADPSPTTSDGCTKAWLRRVWAGAQLAPMRHHIAALLALTFCLAVTIVISVMGPAWANMLINDIWKPFVNTFNEFSDALNDVNANINLYPALVQNLAQLATSIINSSADIINSYGILVLVILYNAVTAFYTAAAFSCAIVVLSMSASYAYIYDDFQRLDRALPKRLVAKDPMSGEPGMVEQEPLIEKSGDKDKGCCKGRPPTFLPGTETPDVASAAFSYMNASNYASLYAIK